MPEPVALLQSVFGYETFRPLQGEIIENVLKRRDTLAILPTGGGKSLCYQIPALIFSGLTVVISPLIALMKDQVEQLEASGVPAVFLNSSLDNIAYQANAKHVRQSKVRLLYIAPEAALTERMLHLMGETGVDLLVIDEAHCISEWGHDFRKDYRQLIELRQRFPQAVCLALTATATQRVRQDIQQSLGFSTADEFVASFNRPNLKLEVISKKNPDQQALEFVRQYKGQSGIIYCFSRSQVDELSAFLVEQGISALPYHAGLEDTQRKANQEAFIHDDVQVIVATIAFGMGINKSNVRFILHYDLPKSIESYYQEIGRAGRDGSPAHCLLLYSYADRRKVQYFIDQKEGLERKIAEQHLLALIRYAKTSGCRRKPLLEHFGERLSVENCGMCDNCLNRQEQAQIDLTIPAQKLISCAMRSSERYGAAYLADLLLGIETERVIQNGHQSLSTYGIGKELTRRQWMDLADLLVEKGYLWREAEYPTLQVTADGRQFLRQRMSFMGRLAVAEKAVPTAAQPMPKPGGGPEPDEGLFEALRARRKEIAVSEHVPPYVIFHDRTLYEMAAYRPQTLESLGRISGVGERKLSKYGEAMLEVIQAYCKEHGLVEIRKAKHLERLKKVEKGEVKKDAKGKGSKFMQAGEGFRGGATLDELADRFGVQHTIVVDYLAQYIKAGYSLPQERLLELVLASPERQKRVFELFDELGTLYLKPVYEASGGEVDEDDLKVLRVVFMNGAIR